MVAQRNQSINVFKKDWKKDELDKKSDFCKGVGHSNKDQCLKLIGYPEWFTANKKKFNDGGSPYGSNSTKMVAHVSTD